MSRHGRIHNQDAFWHVKRVLARLASCVVPELRQHSAGSAVIKAAVFQNSAAAPWGACMQTNAQSCQQSHDYASYACRPVDQLGPERMLMMEYGPGRCNPRLCCFERVPANFLPRHDFAWPWWGTQNHQDQDSFNSLKCSSFKWIFADPSVDIYAGARCSSFMCIFSDLPTSFYGGARYISQVCISTQALCRLYFSLPVTTFEWLAFYDQHQTASELF